MIIETAIFGTILFLAIVKYFQHTTEFSLDRRWKLVNFIKEIKKDPDYSSEFVLLLEEMFLDSTRKNFLPKFIFYIFYIKFFDKKELIKFEKDFNEKIRSNKKEHEAYEKAIDMMFEINFISAPHWYWIFITLSIITMVFRKIYKQLNNGNNEQLKQKFYAEMSSRKFA